MAKINDKSSFFSKKNYLHLKEHVELIEQAFYFIQTYPHVAHDIMILKSYEDNWYETAITWPYIRIWDILTFYRCIEKLKKAKEYFDLPMANKTFVEYKNIYYAEINETLQKHEIHYHFSKMMWNTFNERYGINNYSHGIEVKHKIGLGLI